MACAVSAGNVAARVDQHELAHTLRRDGGEIHANDGA